MRVSAPLRLLKVRMPTMLESTAWVAFDARPEGRP
jgi:hypothetical protein